MTDTGSFGTTSARLALSLSVAGALVVTACSSSGGTGAKSASTAASSSSSSAAPTTSASSSEPPAWGYDHGLVPGQWGRSYPDCADAADAQQSPVDVVTTRLGSIDKAEPVKLALKPTYWKVFNNGHTVEAAPVTAAGEPAEGSAGAIEIGGADYEVAQFHFHAPSEHTLSGKHSALEMHVVGKAHNGATSVLGVLLQVGAANTAIQPIFDAMPTEVTEEEHGVLVKSALDLSRVLPTGVEVVRYEGSLTTPPCTGHVLWDLYRKPITISATEARDFTAKYSDDDRPTQPLHGRRLSLHDVEAA